MTSKRHILLSFFIFASILSVCFAQQNVTYTPLYNTSTFTKTINVALPVGTVAGVANASNGAASYTIPITVPPGTNGVAPSVALSYNSMSGNGVLGNGWSISGLSIISRVGKSNYYEFGLGGPGPVTLTQNDRFALDGSRLLEKTGLYGSDGATYGTEVENFSTITSLGTLGGGPNRFEVTMKDGTVMEYGNTSDSRVLTNDNTKVLFWRLNKIRYPDGNYIEFKYLLADRDSQIDEINYTGNSNTGLLPYNKLKFTYKVRSDIRTTYEANSSLKSNYLLDKITVTAENSAAFKIYSFNYATDNGINSFLKEVIEQGADGTQLNSTISSVRL